MTNKCSLIFLVCIGFFSCVHVLAQADSSILHSRTYARILGNSDLAIGEIRGFNLGDSLDTILHRERAILEAQGDDFLYYRVLCDSTLSAEIAYTFNEQTVLISIGIEFFESCKHSAIVSLSDEFLRSLTCYYKNCVVGEKVFFQCESQTGPNVEYQKQESEMCLIHTQIEFY